MTTGFCPWTARVAGALLLCSTTLEAAVPAFADGQPLPSLAPMLEQVTPAVVNISSQSRVRTRLWAFY